MKLVIFGLTISSSWGNGHATVWRGLCRELAHLRHQVIFFEKNVSYYAAHRDFHEIPGGKLILYDAWSEALCHARRHLADADVAIVTSYCPDGIAAAEIVVASRPLKVFYDLDTPVTLERIESGHSVGYIGASGLRDFDIVLSFTGGRALSGLQSRLGARRAVALYGSVDPDVHRPVTARESYRADLSYIGTYAEDRQAMLNALFLEAARRLPERRFLIAGAQYPPAFSWLPNLFFVRHIAPPDHPALYSSSRLTLNVTRRAMAQAGYCPSGRLFEAAACGTPIVTDYWRALPGARAGARSRSIAPREGRGNWKPFLIALRLASRRRLRAQQKTAVSCGEKSECGELFRRRAPDAGFNRWRFLRNCCRWGADSMARPSDRGRSANTSWNAWFGPAPVASASLSRQVNVTFSNTTAPASGPRACVMWCSRKRQVCAMRCSARCR
jgi:spore maturation protein CgeB